MADGTGLQVPSGEEMAPDLPKWPLSLHPTFGFVGSSADSAQEDGSNQTVTNAQTPKRTGDYLYGLAQSCDWADSPAALNVAPDANLRGGIA